MFLLDSQSASTNSIMLLSRLRPLWEQGALPGNSGVLKLPLLDREGKKIECELTVPVDLLTKYLTDRIGQGIQNFFSAMAKAFAAHPQERVHVLLAGNSSRSAIVQKLFESVAQGPGEQPVEAEATTSTVFGSSATMSELLRMAMRTSSASVQLSQRDVRPAPVSMPVTDSAVPAIVVHQPLASNPEQPYSPNGKTGVAIGLLRLAAVYSVGNSHRGCSKVPRMTPGWSWASLATVCSTFSTPNPPKPTPAICRKGIAACTNAASEFLATTRDIGFTPRQSGHIRYRCVPLVRWKRCRLGIAVW